MQKDTQELRTLLEISNVPETLIQEMEAKPTTYQASFMEAIEQIIKNEVLTLLAFMEIKRTANITRRKVIMKALSLLQPHATLIAVGAKRIETRSWYTKYRGPLAIHASRKLTAGQQALCINEPFFSILCRAGYSIRRSVVTYDKVYADLPTGVIISTCTLVDCVKMTPEFIEAVKKPELDFGEYAVGRYAWILEDGKLLDVPIPAKGALSIWETKEL
ncbi:MAG TPA: ASCH domain-containing protein [Desulfosporosinus sp.]|nr:ASCH domain-containing protein [Desulfosporosinus sp.]